MSHDQTTERDGLPFGHELATCPCGVRFERSQIEPRETRCAVCHTEHLLGIPAVACSPEMSGTAE